MRVAGAVGAGMIRLLCWLFGHAAPTWSGRLRYVTGYRCSRCGQTVVG